MKTTASIALAGLVLSGSAMAAPSFVNGLAIPGATGDQFGSSVNDGRVGFFSDIYYDTQRSEWWGLSDRGPGGGSLSYETRVQRFTLDVDMNSGAISNFQIAETVKFSNLGAAMNGIAPSPSNVLGNALDPEGVVVHPTSGHFFVSDEYGPSVYEMDRNGAVVKTFTVPARLLPRNAASGVANFANDSGNTAGKRTNRGFEGLAISPDGRYVFAMLQSAMLDEGAGNGSINRIVKFDAVSGAAIAQYAYQMKRSGQGQGISSLVALNDHEFLVLERNNRGVGVGAAFATADKEVYKIDLSGATDVSDIDLDSGSAFTAVTKSAQWLDLDINHIDLDGDGDVESAGKSAEKWEGLSLGPRLNDGSYLLLAGTDNDYSVTQNAGGTQLDVYFDFNAADPYSASIQCPLGAVTGCTFTSGGADAALSAQYSLLPGVLHAYKVAAADLGNYVAPVPLPPSLVMMLPGLAWLAARRRRTAI